MRANGLWQKPSTIAISLNISVHKNITAMKTPAKTTATATITR